LGAPEGAPKPEETKTQVSEQAATEVVNEEAGNMQKKILTLVKELDSGMGAEMDTILAKSGLNEEEAKNILFGLLKSGDIYEPKKGRLKVLT
jgi:DNA replicative helicase MCM subunit Mcm2 (Cdc46/Mcm family)